MHLEKIIIIGDVASVPEQKTTLKGQEVTEFKVKVKFKRTDKETGEIKENFNLYNIIHFSHKFVKLEEFELGKEIYVEGKPDVQPFNDGVIKKIYLDNYKF